MSNNFDGPKLEPLTWLMLIMLSIVWGGTFFFQEIAVKELPVLTIVTIRVFLAAVTLIGVSILFGQSLPRSLHVWRALFFLAMINNVIPFSLIVWGQKEVASGLAAILNATAPMFAVLFAHLSTSDEKITRIKLIGAFIGFLGATILVGLEALEDIGIALLSQLAILAATAAYAYSGVYGRRFRELGVSPLSTATGQLLASVLILIPLTLFIDQPWMLSIPSGNTVAALIGLATISTAFAYVLYFRILEAAGATNLLLVTFLIPISALTLGFFILDEELTFKHLIGIVFIGLALIAIDGRLLTKK